MSRSRLPPTPSMSGEFIVKDQPAIEGTDVFALPPAAIDTGTSGRSSKTAGHLPASPAASPDFMALGRSTNSRQQTSGTKRPLEDFDLPPPPTRTRKIIQMKPKTQQSPSTKSGAGAGADGKGSKESGKVASSSNNAGAGAAAAPASGNKKKQPTATSAAGRKIARKTAHSLIERRRRSKMNEEFTTLKDMIPACTGQEMHKLAILQASIDYVNYLEQCIKDLKTAGGAAPSRLPPALPSPTSPEFFTEMVGSADSERSASVSPEFLPENTQIPDTSPLFSPRTRIPSMSTTYEFAPSILPSPALGPSQPEKHPSWPASTNTSPALQPQPNNNADVDHEASAALLMLNQDRRGTLDSIVDKVSDASLVSRNSREGQETGRRKCMSVRDLLIS